jgi:hypothetical protein
MWEMFSLEKLHVIRLVLSVKLRWALCLPDGCNTDDANLMGNFLLTNVVGEEVGC